MNFYCVDWITNTGINLRDGIRAGAPILTREGDILEFSTGLYGQEAIDSGKVAAFKIDFPESEQEKIICYLGMLERRKKERQNTICYKKEIPREWIEAAFSVYDYWKCPTD